MTIFDGEKRRQMRLLSKTTIDKKNEIEKNIRDEKSELGFLQNKNKYACCGSLVLLDYSIPEPLQPRRYILPNIVRSDVYLFFLQYSTCCYRHTKESCQNRVSHLGQMINLICLQIDDLVPHLPLWEVVQDLPCRADLNQETRVLYRSCRSYGSHPGIIC